jgi:hypothetical protein
MYISSNFKNFNIKLSLVAVRCQPPKVTHKQKYPTVPPYKMCRCCHVSVFVPMSSNVNVGLSAVSQLLLLYYTVPVYLLSLLMFLMSTVCWEKISYNFQFSTVMVPEQKRVNQPTGRLGILAF